MTDSNFIGILPGIERFEEDIREIGYPVKGRPGSMKQQRPENEKKG
ncbi:hypothetical protein RSX24_016305 [Paenibacillus sp. ES5-4]